MVLDSGFDAAGPLCAAPRRRLGMTLSQLADLRLHQRPAFRSEFFLPDRIDAGELGAERGLVDLVENQAALEEVVAQAGVKRTLIQPLLPHGFGDVALD